LAGYIFWLAYAGNHNYPFITFDYFSLTATLAGTSDASQFAPLTGRIFLSWNIRIWLYSKMAILAFNYILILEYYNI